MERTLSILKPDATRRDITGLINSMIEINGMRVVAQKRVLLTRRQAVDFYEEHRNMPFFDSLVENMTAGPVVLQVLQGEDVAARYRKLMGATDPQQADPGTIRSEYGEDISRNSVHGSETASKAEREINFFFTPEEILE